MIKNKYSTRLQKNSSKEIVKLYQKRNHRKSLPPIISLLNNIEIHYKEYPWNPERIKEFEENEQREIDENRRNITNVLNQCFKLEFKRDDKCPNE